MGIFVSILIFIIFALIVALIRISLYFYNKFQNLYQYLHTQETETSKTIRNMQERIQENSVNIEDLENANDNPVFKNRIIEILEDHFEETDTQVFVLRGQRYRSRQH